MVHALASAVCEATVMASFEEHLPQISLDDCERIRRRANAYLAEGLPTPDDASPTLRAALARSPRGWVVAGTDPILPAFARTLTQMRLLRLHMRIEAYRWRNLKLPDGLRDAAPETEYVDPLLQEPYAYVRSVSTYRLTSSGFPSLGPMGLRYRRAPDFVPAADRTDGRKP